jgi:serine/threonine protein kinase
LPFQILQMDKNKMQKIKEEAAKLGTSYYKFVEPFIININDKIGRGSYGEVFKGADIRTGQLVAVKTISTSNIKKDP